ncbi:permease [Pseudoduganella sp. OTU4001]|uniref:permease n=1 Tax=Pseudoduganella sp. OTU4001 TaxID=3043854 RepID=UPI00313AB904
MQRKLAFEHTPGLALPLRFLLAAPWFGALAGLLLVWQGAEAMTTRWAPATLAVTHLITLGYLGMAMAGSLLQMVPVVAGVELHWGRKLAPGIWGALGGGTLLLACGFLCGLPWCLRAGGVLLAGAFALLVAVLARALAQRSSPAALPVVAGIRQAVLALGGAAGAGVTLVAVLVGAVRLQPAVWTNVHAAWALVGWVGVLVVSVVFQVVPMFQSTQLFPRPLAFALPPLTMAGLALWTAGYLADRPWQWMGAGLAGVCLAVFAVYTLLLLKRRKRAADVSTWYWWLALGALLASVVLQLCPRGGDKSLVLGVLFIGGFAVSAVNGMLYKIVPFLLWYHGQHAGCDVPGVRQMMPDSEPRVQLAWHAASVVLLLGAALAPGWLAQLAGAVLAAACMRLGFDLALAAVSLRRPASAQNPES